MKPNNRPRAAWWLAAVALILIAVGCNDDDTPTQPAPPPDPPRVTERFQGTFGQNQTSEHQFTVVATGDVEMKITRLQPVATLTVGMGIGDFDATMDPSCSVFASDNRVVVNSTLLSADVPPGEYCVRVGDVGNVFPGATVSYTVEVVHP